MAYKQSQRQDEDSEHSSVALLVSRTSQAVVVLPEKNNCHQRTKEPNMLSEDFIFVYSPKILADSN